MFSSIVFHFVIWAIDTHTHTHTCYGQIAATQNLKKDEKEIHFVVKGSDQGLPLYSVWIL